MPTPPSLPPPLGSHDGNALESDRSVVPPLITGTPGEKPQRTFLYAMLGTFGGLVLFAVIASALYFGYTSIRSPIVSRAAAAPTRASGTTPSTSAGPATSGKKTLYDPTKWTLGAEPADNVQGNVPGDVSLWARLLDLPKNEAVISYLKQEGIDVSVIRALHYDNRNGTTTITYEVTAVVPQELVRVPKASWLPRDPDMRPFADVLVLNSGLPAGQFWNTAAPSVAAQPGTHLDFAWKLRWEKAPNAVTTDRLPYSDGVFTPQQIAQFQAESSTTIAKLQGRIQQINAQVAADVQARLAQVPPNPPRPGLQSGHFGGDGSGEPTKSAERIGGGTVAGAAGGAAFGAAAGDAGLGAGIGAGVGLLGGLIYDGVSKHNDRERYQRRVVAANSERLSAWRAQIRQLEQQRDQIRRQGDVEKQQLLNNLAQQIAVNGGNLDAVPAPADVPPATPPATPSDAPQSALLNTTPSRAPAPVASTPGADTPSGPIAAPVTDSAPALNDGASHPALGNVSDLTADNGNDLAAKKQLLGYWRSPRHDYCRSSDGICYMLNGASTKSSWDVVGGLYYESGSAYDIVALTDTQFIFRERGGQDITFTEKRITQQQAGQ